MSLSLLLSLLVVAVLRLCWLFFRSVRERKKERRKLDEISRDRAVSLLFGMLIGLSPTRRSLVREAKRSGFVPLAFVGI